MKQQDIEITLTNRVLTIKGTRSFEGKNTEQVMLGRSYGAFSRSYTLPEALDEANLTAELADGVLTVRIPKLPKAQPRKIQIGTAGTTKQLNE